MIFSAALAAAMVQSFAVAEPSAAPPVIGGPPEVWVAGRERRHGRPSGVMAGSCVRIARNMDGDEERLIYVIVPLTRGEPAVVQMGRFGRQKLVTNVGDLRFSKGKVEVSENMGGLWTRAMLRDAANWIAKRKLRRYGSYRDALAQEPKLRCPPK